MVQPDSSSFAAGDAVTLKDMPDATGLNGSPGTLVKSVGKDRWVVDIKGSERTRIVTTANLQHAGSGPTKPSQAYFIVGTWDEWEPHEMTWSANRLCFCHEAALGSDTVGNFKFLIDGDWDQCIYPDCGSATPGDGHKMQGPDDGGLDTDWTITRHQEDRGNARYDVRLFVTPDGRPARVDWQPLDRDEEPSMQQHHMSVERESAAPSGRQRSRPGKFGQLAAGRAAPESQGEGLEESAAPTAAVASRPRSTGRQGAFAQAQMRISQEDRGLNDFSDHEHAYVPKDTLGSRLRRGESPDYGRHPERLQAAQGGDDILEIERQARRRLEMRLKQADEAEVLAIEDQKKRDEEEEGPYQEWIGMKAKSFENLSRWRSRAAAQQDRGLATRCVDCGKPAETHVNQEWVCKICHDAWQKAVEAGWNSSAMCDDGYYAAEWAQWFGEKQNLLPRDARFEVMRRFSTRFQAIREEQALPRG